MNLKYKNALLTILFYIVSISAIIYFNFSDDFKSGPCTPNLDLISFMLFGPVILVLSLVNAFTTYKLKRETKYSFFIHFIALFIWLTLFI